MQTQSTLTVGPDSVTLVHTEQQKDGSIVTTSVHGRRVGSNYVLTLNRYSEPPPGPEGLSAEAIRKIEKELNLLY
jgi:hypothetical protein